MAIQKCLAADQSYITLAKSLVSTAPPGKILTLFAAMVVHHIKEHKRWVTPPAVHDRILMKSVMSLLINEYLGKPGKLNCGDLDVTLAICP